MNAGDVPGQPGPSSPKSPERVRVHHRRAAALIATSYHVIDDAYETVQVMFSDGACACRGRVIATAPIVDLALVAGRHRAKHLGGEVGLTATACRSPIRCSRRQAIRSSLGRVGKLRHRQRAESRYLESAHATTSSRPMPRSTTAIPAALCNAQRRGDRRRHCHHLAHHRIGRPRLRHPGERRPIRCRCSSAARRQHSVRLPRHQDR